MLAVVEKESREGVGAGVEVIFDAVGGGLTDEDRAVFAAFTTHHKLATIEINRIAVEVSEFRDAEAARI